MWMQIVAGAAWLLWLSSGTAGLDKGLTVGALLVLGLGLKNILDTFWKHKPAEAGEEASAPHAPRNRGYQSQLSLSVPQTGKSAEPPALRGFERRFANPRA